eukprot:symbB.v1.2.032038.t1/scaffold3793.1/size50245/2
MEGEATAPASSAGPALIDTRAYGRLRTFSGKEEDWATWSFVARSYLDLLSQQFRDLMLKAETVDTAASITLTGMNQNARTHSWTLFNVLTQSVEGLVDASEFLEVLETWEVLIRRYEEQSKEAVNDPTQCAVVMKHAPSGIRLALRTASSSIDSNYARLKRCVKDYLQTGLNYDQQGTSVPAKDTGGPAPMDVGAIQKGDNKGKWGKGKDKGGKGKKGKKGKEKGVMKASGKSRRFDGYCSYCEKYGHKKADCRQRARDQQGAGKGKGSTNAVEATGGGSSSSTHPPSTTAAVFYKLECKDEIDYGDEVEEKTTWEVRPVPQGRHEEPKGRSWADWSEEERWVSGVEKDDPSMAAAVESRQSDFIMYDTGSDEHVCMEEFAGWGAERSSTVKLNAVSGDQLTLIGEKQLVLGIEGAKDKVGGCATQAIVAPVEVGGEPQDDWEQMGLEYAEEEPGHPLGDIRGGDVERSRMSLTPFDRVEDMRARLRELGWPVHGVKQDVFRRLQAAEKEERKRLQKEREARDDIAARHDDLVRGAHEVPKPPMPTAKEVARHNLTHLPSATWCEHCVRGKGKEAAHFRRPEKERAVVQMDFSYLKADGSEAVEDPAEVVLTVVDCQTGLCHAMSLPAKNFEKNYVVKTIKEFVAQLGHSSLAIRTDGEPMIVQLAEAVRDELTQHGWKGTTLRVTTERTPRYSPQSLGSVGAAQSMLKGDVLCWRSSLEEALGREVNPTMSIWPWMVRHASWTRSRFGIKANRRTAFEDCFGHPYPGQIVPFGDMIMFKMPSSHVGRRTEGQRQLKGDFSWEKAVFLGKTLESDEYLVGTRQGVHTTRTVRRMREDLRKSREAVENMKGVPWNMLTTIGRPRKAIIADGVDRAAPGVPKPAASADVPGEPRQEMVRGEKKQRGEAQPAPEAKRVRGEEIPIPDEDFEDALDQEIEVEQASGPSSGSVPHAAAEVRMPETETEMQATDAWRKREAELKSSAGDQEMKRLKVGEQFIGALYTPVDPDVWIDDVEEDIIEAEEEVDEMAWIDHEITAEEELAGKKKELDKMDSMETYEPVPTSETAGKKILDSTWVVTRKEDGTVKCRYCLREFKKSSWRDDVYAASTTSATARVIDVLGTTSGYAYFTADATNAFWQVPIKEEAYMKPPDEWLSRQEEKGLPTDVMWKLKKEWYGRRVAGTRWVEFIAEIVVGEGFQRCSVAPWFFHHPGKRIAMEIHMDDMYGCGPRGEIEEFLKAVHKKVKMKSQVHDKDSTWTHLKRKRVLNKNGDMFIQADEKHLEAVMELLMIKGCKEAQTPGCSGGTTSQRTDKLSEMDARKFRTATGILMYMAPDRPDCQQAIRNLTKSLKEPTGAEFNGGVAACSEGLFFKQIFEFFGYPIAMRVWMDSSAARGIFQRQGVGRVRHLEAKCLWAQDALKQKKFEIKAVNTHENVADMGTKALPVSKHNKFKEMMDIVSLKTFEDGKEASENEAGVVGSIQQVTAGLKFLALLGMSQIPGAASERSEDEGTTGVPERGNWMEWMLVVSMVWMAISVMVATTAGVMQAWKKMMRRPKKLGGEDEDEKETTELAYHPEGGEETKPSEEAVRRRRGFNNKMVEEHQREREIQRSPMRMKMQAASVAASSTTTETPEEKIYEVINGRVFNKNKQEMMTGEDWLMKMHISGKALINRGAIEKAFLDRDDLEVIITG